MTVLDRDMIRASGARNISELFRLVPGFQVAMQTGNTPQVKNNVKGYVRGFDVKTGKKKWEQKDVGGSFTMADGKFLTFTGEQLILLDASTDEYKELARSQKLFLPEEVSFRYSDRIAPVLSNGRIYCRSQNGFLVCLDVSGK